jgi:hypothetical protein
MMFLLSNRELADIVRHLPPLTATGSGVPLVALARARYLRQRTLEILWQETAGESEREHVLALICARREAHWWCRPDLHSLLAFVRSRPGCPQSLPT